MKRRSFVSVLPTAIVEAIRVEATTLGRLLAITAGIILLFVTPCAAQEGISAKVEEYIKAEMQRQRIPGLSLAVIKRRIEESRMGFACPQHHC